MVVNTKGRQSRGAVGLRRVRCVVVDFSMSVEVCRGNRLFPYFAHRIDKTMTNRSTCLSRLFTLAFIAMFALAGSVPALAADDDDDTEDVDTHHHHEAHHARHVALFVGGTSAAGHTSFTLGGEAEYRLPVWQQRFGVGALVDATFGDHAHTIAGGLLTARPVPGVGNVKLMLAPAALFSHGHSYFLMRTGLAVDFHVQSFSISPMVDLDFVKGGVDTVFGVAFGVAF